MPLSKEQKTILTYLVNRLNGCIARGQDKYGGLVRAADLTESNCCKTTRGRSVHRTTAGTGKRADAGQGPIGYKEAPKNGSDKSVADWMMYMILTIMIRLNTNCSADYGEVTEGYD